MERLSLTSEGGVPEMEMTGRVAVTQLRRARDWLNGPWDERKGGPGSKKERGYAAGELTPMNFETYKNSDSEREAGTKIT